MAEHLVLADGTTLGAVMNLIEQRIGWMEQIGLRQWNTDGYQAAYPPAYFADKMRRGELYMLKRDGRVAAAAVLLEADDRWPEGGSALYLHTFVADRREKGAGGALLALAEALARERGKDLLRLDCAADNPRLNDYYAQKGYRPAGRCAEGGYAGILREKRLR